MTIVTVAAIGVAAGLLAAQLKEMKSSHSFFLSAAAGLFIFFYGLKKLETILAVLETIQRAIRLDDIYLVTLMKMVGITYIGEAAAGICKDNGCSFLGRQIEIFGRLSILAVSAPVVLALLDTLERFLS